jgi:hypothetical protein
MLTAMPVLDEPLRQVRCHAKMTGTRRLVARRLRNSVKKADKMRL